MFLAVGALTSQLGATRRQAASYAAVFLGVAYAVRMIADAGVGLHGLIWASPLGWVEELQTAHRAPAPGPRADRRLHGGARPSSPCTSPAPATSGRASSPTGRPADPSCVSCPGPSALPSGWLRPTVIGWWVAIAVSGLLYGLIAKSAGGTISGSSVQKVFSKLGAPGTGAAAVLGVCFLILAVLVAFVAAGQLTAARSEESERQARPPSRPPGLAVLRGSAAGSSSPSSCSSPAAVTAGVFAWLGAASQHAGVSFTTLLEAGVNLVPPALAILGIGVLAFGIRPRMTSIVVYALLGWSLLIVIVGGIGAMSHWVLDTSVFHQMASAPAVAPHWEANGIMVAIGVVSARSSEASRSGAATCRANDPSSRAESSSPSRPQALPRRDGRYVGTTSTGRWVAPSVAVRHVLHALPRAYERGAEASRRRSRSASWSGRSWRWRPRR